MAIICATDLAQDGQWPEAMGETHCKCDANLESSYVYNILIKLMNIIYWKSISERHRVQSN